LPEKLVRKLEIVPTDPEFVPSEQAIALALEELKSSISEEDACDSWTSDFVQVIGLFDSNYQSMVCPRCSMETALSESDIFSIGENLFVEPPTDIEITMPCCDSRIPLSSIDFSPYVRFARFGLNFTGKKSSITDEMVKRLGYLLGGPMAVVNIEE
jgi:hypothetical protein